jgi:magnesium chelatase family protein
MSRYVRFERILYLYKKICKLSKESKTLLKIATEKLNLSARAYERILKVSRTILI